MWYILISTFGLLVAFYLIAIIFIIVTFREYKDPYDNHNNQSKYMSNNSQKSTLVTFKTWLKDINPKSESLHQPKAIVPIKPYYEKKY